MFTIRDGNYAMLGGGGGVRREECVREMGTGVKGSNNLAGHKWKAIVLHHEHRTFDSSNFHINLLQFVFDRSKIISLPPLPLPLLNISNN